jgi:hypothetical protein
MKSVAGQSYRPPNWIMGHPPRIPVWIRWDQSVWLYIQENPVRAGLVKNSKDWPYQIGLDEPIEL